MGATATTRQRPRTPQGRSRSRAAKSAGLCALASSFFPSVLLALTARLAWKPHFGFSPTAASLPVSRRGGVMSKDDPQASGGDAISRRDILQVSTGTAAIAGAAALLAGTSSAAAQQVVQ